MVNRQEKKQGITLTPKKTVILLIVVILPVAGAIFRGGSWQCSAVVLASWRNISSDPGQIRDTSQRKKSSNIMRHFSKKEQMFEKKSCICDTERI